jgi:ribosomal peptide maturation radical SAM protein 1
VSKPSVLLITMPWHRLSIPSIQLGLLQSVLEREGIRTEVATLALAFMEHCWAESAGLPRAERIDPADYEAVASDHSGIGLGDWIFAVPPFRDAAESDARYLAFLRARRVPAADIEKALTMRRLVPPFLDRMADEILAAGPRVVGFTSSFSQAVPSLVLAQLLKRHEPSLTIVFGGANCEGPMGAALHRTFPWVDIVVRGEAEPILPDLMRDLLSGEPVRPRPGLCYRNGDRSVVVPQAGGTEVSLDEIPTPTFDEYFDRLAQSSFAAELARDVTLVYESARGCWWGAKSHCTFCGLNGTSMTFRSKSPARVEEELTTLARRYGRLDFQMVDNILDLRYFRDVLPRLRETGYGFNLFYETKANLRREQVRLLREAGITRIQPGLESLSTSILRRMRKGVTAFQNVRLLKWCAEYGVHVYWNVIFGFPGEPPEEYARMAEVVPSLAHLEPPTLGGLVLDRFSPYHERPGEFGLEILGPRSWYQYVYDTDDATLMDLASTFEYRHLDGRDPETYVAPLRRAIDTWRANGPASYRALRYRRGPGFLVVHERRPDLEPADYSFEEREARLYLACEDGATAEEAWASLRATGATDVDVDDVEAFLDELVTLRLVYEENGRYLALALPANLLEAV